MYTNFFRYYDKIRTIYNIYDYVINTPITYGYKLSKLTKNNILYKREDFQYTHSFEIRGACIKLKSLSENNKKKGIILSSTGNFAQGVAFISNRLKIKSTIIMPINTPINIIDDIKIFGQNYTNIILYGNNYIESYNKANEISYNQSKLLISSFDDPYIIAGNSTIGYEIWRDYKNVDKIFVPIKSGRCIAGIAISIKYLNPNIKIIGVLLNDSNKLQITYLDDIHNHFVDDIITVNNDEIYEAIKIGYNDTRVLFESEGVLSIAGIYKYTKMHNTTDKNIVAILSGANYDLSKLNFIK